jgi:purine-binding chemotaxis protein CheW
VIREHTSRVTSAIEEAVQHLTFRLGREDYAIDIRYVQELKGYVTITPIPNAPAHIKGVMNLRGAILPVVDLRDRFGMAQVPYDKFTVIVVVEVLGKLSGLVVDAVTDVVNIRASDVAPPPDLGMGVDTSFMCGMTKATDSMLIVLDLERTIGEVMNYKEALASASEQRKAASPALDQEREAEP